jgi:hypothetical protein
MSVQIRLAAPILHNQIPIWVPIIIWILGFISGLVCRTGVRVAAYQPPKLQGKGSSPFSPAK